MTTKQKVNNKIKVAAKRLYLEVNPDGQPSHSLRQIETMLQSVSYRVENESYRGEISRQALMKWIKKHDWEDERKQLMVTAAKFHEAKIQEEARREAEQAKEEAKEDRREIHGKASATIELGRDRNEEAFEKAHGMIMERLKSGSLSDHNLISLYKALGSENTRYNEMLADAAVDRKINLNVNIKVIEVIPAKPREKVIEGEVK